MECAVHAGVTATGQCSTCNKHGCEECLTYDVDGRVTCSDCGAIEYDRSRALGSALLALVAVGYLATLAIGYLVLRARPFVGGLAAVVAIALGRAIQIVLHIPVVTRRAPHPG